MTQEEYIKLVLKTLSQGNRVVTLGHQAIKFDPPEFSDEGFPVISKIGLSYSGQTKYPYLGEGYYFWDNFLWPLSCIFCK